MTSEDARKGWGKLLTQIQARVRGAVVLRRYRDEVAVLVPTDWYRKAVAAIGQPEVAVLPKPDAADDK